MTSEKKSSPIMNLVDKVMGSISTPEKSEQLTFKLQKRYGKYSNVLAFISKIADPSVLLVQKKDDSITKASEKQCKNCDHPHINHERHQTDSFIHIHDPVQKQHYHSTCFRNSLPSPCWDCSECYEDNQLSAGDDVEHEAMAQYSWVWRDTKTINGTTGHLVYQVPDSTKPIRTRDGFAIPWHRYYCDDRWPKNPAADLKRANRIAIKDLIEEDYGKTQARAEKCNEMIEKFSTKSIHVENENDDYYGFILDTTELDTEDRVAVWTLFDMAIVETMKIHPEITSDKFNVEVARRIRIWTHDHFFACNGAIWNALRNIEAQGFIERRVNEDKSNTLLSDFDNKECTRNEIVQGNDAALSVSTLERAELNTTSSLQRLQAALTVMSGHATEDIDTFKNGAWGLGSGHTVRSLTDLQAAMVKAHATLEDLESDKAGCQDALTLWKTSLAKFDTNSKLPIETIKTALAETYGKNSGVTLNRLQKAVADLRPELDELRAGLDACRSHIAGCRTRKTPGSTSDCGDFVVRFSDDGSSNDGSSGHVSSDDISKETKD